MHHGKGPYEAHLWRRIGASLFLVVAGIGTGAPVFADRDIVYAGQYYRWSGEYHRSPYGGKPQPTLDDVGPSHLYRINPDGSGRTRLTSGPYNDWYPAWSPNGRYIAFMRSDPEDLNVRLCLIDAGGGPVRTLVGLDTGDLYHYARGPQWSPDGASIAFLHGGAVAIRDMKTGRVRDFPFAFNFAWSPDGQRLFLSVGEQGAWSAKRADRIYTLSDGRWRSAVASVTDPVWHSTHTVIGELPSARESITEYLRVLDERGRPRQKVRVRWHGRGRRNYRDQLFTEFGRWRAIPGRREQLVYEQGWSMSDGVHHACYLVNWKTGRARFLRAGRCIGVSPDGRQVAVADRYWIGPYKHGGRRCGPLEIVSLQTGRAHAITSRLISIEGGDWRKTRR